MRPTVPVLLTALALVVAGCIGMAPGAGTTPTPTEASPPTDTAAVTDTATPSPAPARTPAENVSVEYAVGAGDVPDEFGTVTLTVRAVFVENERDFAENRCWRTTYHGPYKPTPTPIGMPDGDCHRSEPVTVNLTAIEDTESLGQFTAPDRFDAGHGFIVTNITATHRNGSTITDIRGMGGHRVNIVEGPPEGSYRVEFAVGADDEPRAGGNTYWLVSESRSA